MSATLLYGLREALALVCREGLENVITRHQKAAVALQSALVELGLQLHVRNVEHRLPTITSVNLPRDIDWKQIVDFAANEYVLDSHQLPFIRYNFMCEFNCFDVFCFFSPFWFYHIGFSSVEIAGGLGPTAGEIIRVGLMGDNARQQYVDKAISIVKTALKHIRGLSNL